MTQKTSALSYKTYRNTYELNGEKAVIRYLEIPLNVKFKFNANTSVPLSILPFLAFSLLFLYNQILCFFRIYYFISFSNSILSGMFAIKKALPANVANDPAVTFNIAFEKEPR